LGEIEGVNAPERKETPSGVAEKREEHICRTENEIVAIALRTRRSRGGGKWGKQQRWQGEKDWSACLIINERKSKNPAAGRPVLDQPYQARTEKRGKKERGATVESLKRQKKSPKKSQVK